MLQVCQSAQLPCQVTYPTTCSMDDKQRCIPISAGALNHHILQLSSPQQPPYTRRTPHKVMHGAHFMLHVATAAAVVVTPADELWCVNAFDEVCVVWAWCMVLQQLFLLTAG